MRFFIPALFAVVLSTEPCLASQPEVLVLMDCSGSMLEVVPGSGRTKISIPGGTIAIKGTAQEQAKGESRIDGAKRALLSMIDRLPSGTKLGLRIFAHRYGGRSDAQKGLSCKDTELIFPIAIPDRRAMKARVPEITCKGWTPLAYGLEEAGKDFADTADVERTIVALSDGKETCGGDPVAMAKRLRESGLKVVTDVIGFAVDAATRAQLEQVAQAGGGKYYNADDAARLAESLAQAVKAAPPPPPSPSESPSVAAPPPAKIAFADDFDGVELSDAWKRLNTDDARFTLDGGAATFITRTWEGRDKETGEPKIHNLLRLERPLPDDFEVSLEFDCEFSHSNLRVGLRFSQGPGQDEIWSQIYEGYGNKGMTFWFSKTVGGQVSVIETPWGFSPPPPQRMKRWLIVRKVGRTWETWLKTEEKEYLEGRLEQKVLKLKPKGLEICVCNAANDRELEVNVNRIEVKDLSKK